MSTVHAADGAQVEVLLASLERICASVQRAGVAVSGGVDSMTLAAIAWRALGPRFTAYHATSPAVPPQATDRVRRHAARHGWPLRVIDAGEFADADYLANPHNRCYFCKRNLYQRIQEVTDCQVFSGANADDLGDYRPGLLAAAERQVRHPFVEAGVDKAGVRALAAHLGLSEVQDLPAMPCLSSRVESGIAIDPAALAFVNEVEEWLRTVLPARTVRCRIVRDGVRVELDDAGLTALGGAAGAALRTELETRCAGAGQVLAAVAPYRRGSAFLVPGRS